MNASATNNTQRQEFLEEEVKQLKKELDKARAICEDMYISLQKEKEREVKIEEALLIIKKRLEIVMGFSDVCAFEYNIKTKKMITQHADFEVFGMPAVLENSIEEIIGSGIIDQRSADDFREMYNKIDRGDPSAKTIVYAIDINGNECILEIQLITVYDKFGEPICAVGVRKDITDSSRLKKEKEYGDIMVLGRVFIYEANVTKNKIIRYDDKWVKEAGITDALTFSGMIEALCKVLIDTEGAERVASQLSRESIEKYFKSGQQLISCEYRRKVGAEAYLWFENNVNIIKDDLTGDINIRCYEVNIEAKKKKEFRALAEQKQYEIMISKSETVYEINITKNLSIFGHENWKDLFGIEISSNYTEMITKLSQEAIYPKDSAGFMDAFCVEHVLSKFKQGKSQIMYEYRRLDETGEYVWVRCTMHLFEELDTGDVKGFSYVEKIDEEKKKELNLIYRAQHDMLTGLYNKMALEEKIEEFFSTNEGKAGKHVFFIIDIDYFKLINDNFGHAFGDAVLSQTASKIQSLFREDDIIGRIGGDEFVVLMKNIQSEQAGILKAKEICDCVAEDYLKNQVNYRVAVSIGIANYKSDGKTYEELYKHSDAALYHAKEHGRNRFSVYNKDMRFNASAIKEIEYPTLEVKNFEEK